MAFFAILEGLGSDRPVTVVDAVCEPLEDPLRTLWTVIRGLEGIKNGVLVVLMNHKRN